MQFMPAGTPVMKAIELSKLTRAFVARYWLAPLMLLCASQATAMRPLEEHSYAQIEQAYAGLPLLVAVWSLDCPPCRKELDMLGRLKQEYSGFNLVLINTDGVELASEAEALLSTFDLSSAEAWIFATDQLERLRYSIDPQWYGELPRSYLYYRGERQGYSGLIDELQLREWLDTSSR